MRYLSYFYDPKEFCAQKDRINKCPGCKCAGNVKKYGITAAPVTPGSPAQTEKEKCESRPGWSWWVPGPGDTWTAGCWEDA